MLQLVVWGEIDVKISGGVRAPFFLRGKHTNDEWVSTIRNYPAPFAEIGTERLIVTVPSSEVRSMTDPQALVDKYDKYIDMFADLAVVSFCYVGFQRASGAFVTRLRGGEGGACKAYLRLWQLPVARLLNRCCGSPTLIAFWSAPATFPAHATPVPP